MTPLGSVSNCRLAAANDYDVNIKAEIEIMALHDKLDRMRLAELADLVREQGEAINALCRPAAR